MHNIIRSLFTVVTSLVFSSCIFDDGENCGMYLEFTFDLNMEYADAFDPQIDFIDVFIFDGEGTFLFSKHADRKADMINGNRIYLSNNDLDLGKYHIIALGSMSENFRFTDFDGTPCRARLTTIDEVKLALHRDGPEVSHEFPHVWFGENTGINYRADNSVVHINMVRNTNKFNIILEDIDGTRAGTHEGGTPPYTFELVTPEGAAYGHDNKPLIRERLTYRPYSLSSGEDPNILSVGHLNTMRLFENDEDGYLIRILSSENSEEVWSYDLMKLLRHTKPQLRADKTPLPMQEYLDRQGQWNIAILYREVSTGVNSGFIAVGVEVNDWIVWIREIEA